MNQRFSALFLQELNVKQESCESRFAVLLEPESTPPLQRRVLFPLVNSIIYGIKLAVLIQVLHLKRNNASLT